MTASALARHAYNQTTKTTASARSIERQLLARLTTAMVVAEKNRKTDHPGYIHALSKNLEFWTVVAGDVASENNKLPQELRANLFYLFEFTRAHSRKIINGDDALDTEPLIEINQNIIRGLQGAEEQPQP